MTENNKPMELSLQEDWDSVYKGWYHIAFKDHNNNLGLLFIHSFLILLILYPMICLCVFSREWFCPIFRIFSITLRFGLLQSWSSIAWAIIILYLANSQPMDIHPIGVGIFWCSQNNNAISTILIPINPFNTMVP